MAMMTVTGRNSKNFCQKMLSSHFSSQRIPVSLQMKQVAAFGDLKSRISPLIEHVDHYSQCTNFRFARFYSTTAGFETQVPVITKQELQKKIQQSNSQHRLIDVRQPEELIGDMPLIPTARNVPLQELENAMTLSEEQFQERYGFEKPKEHDEVILYCKAGVRSTKACQLLKSMGYKKYVE